MAAESRTKRRKTRHVASSGEDDVVSFDSLGGLQDEDTDTRLKDDETEVDARESDREVPDVADDEDGEGVSEDGSEVESMDISERGVTGRQRDTDPHASATPKHHTAADKAPISANNSAYTANTFKSNIFKLQVDELLGQLRPKRMKRETEAEDALHVLKRVIEQIAPLPATPIEDAERDLVKSSEVVVPFPEPRPGKDAKYKMEYAKPTNINVVGSYALKISSRRREILEIDMSVQMPSSIFQEKDYLNYRYFYKRAFYIAVIAARLKQELKDRFDIKFALLHGDQLKPIIDVSPRAEEGGRRPESTWQVQIIPTTSDVTFTAERLLPDKNCIRSTPSKMNGDEATANLKATPYYNASVRADTLVASYLKFINSAAKDCVAFQDACLLGTAWLRQRGFGSDLNAGGFGTFEWSVTIALLLQGGGPGGKPSLSAGYSSYQLLKATLQCLAMKDFQKQNLVVGQPNVLSKASGSRRPVLWDATRRHNVLYKMTAWSYKLLRHEARSSLSMLNDQAFDGFEAAFVHKSVSPLTRYDLVIEVPYRSLDTGIIAYHPDETFVAEKLYRILSRGLGDRAQLLSIILEKSQPWSLKSACPKRAGNVCIRVGVIVNADTVDRTVDHGPRAESKASAAAFREFWGDKAELRRFKDGSILESLVWDNKARISILEQIVRHLLQRHFSHTAGEDAKLFGDGSTRLLGQRHSMSLFQPLNEAYNQLERDVRSLHELPLLVRQLMPADSQLRFAGSITSTGLKGRSRAADVTLQFEGSGRWPDDLAAIQRTKIALLLKLTQLLENAEYAVTTSAIGLENEQTDILNQAFLDIAYDSGASFRLRIQHDREQTLLEQRLKDKGLDSGSKEVVAGGLATYKRNYLRTPAHTQSLARLCNRFAALSGSMRLMKKWFESHLLSNHFSDEIIELMVARVFVHPWPYQAPGSVQTGFLRALTWLARWDWRAEPFVVDLSGTGALKQSDLQGFQTRFEAWRKLDPLMNRVCIFAVSSVDPDGTTYTDGSPAKVVATRMTALAKAAYAEMNAKELELNIASLFASPLQDFDFAIHFAETASGSRSKKHKTNGRENFKNLELAAANDVSLVGFDPAMEFLRDIERAYGQAILFFYGSAEKAVIAGLWSPQTARRAWKVNLTYSTVPIVSKDGDEILADVNKEAILSEISRLGGDLVERIEVFKH